MAARALVIDHSRMGQPHVAHFIPEEMKSAKGMEMGDGLPTDGEQVEIPAYDRLLWPTLLALRSLGGSGSNLEIVDRVLSQQGFSEAQQAVLHGDGPGTDLAYRIAWARTYLKGMGLATNSERGVWAVTERGQSAVEADMQQLRAEYIARHRASRGARQESLPQDGEEENGEPGWDDVLLEAILAMPADAFERLAQRLLREADFISVSVTGRSGDAGIDGVGIYRLSLISFQVFFQCKRYSGSVGPDKVRDFRGAMAGRGDKGLLITTGTFTSEAKREATRDGAPPIDLIDGQELCRLLKRYGLGVSSTIRQEEDITVDPSFFAHV